MGDGPADGGGKKIPISYSIRLFLVISGTKCIPKALQDDSVVLNILLSCEVTKLSEIKQVHFQSLPTTLLEIKKKTEEDFSIPSCFQTLHYQSMILKDSDQLQHTRSGDTFTVDYPIEADCKMTQTVIKWLKELLIKLNSIEENISSPCLGASTFKKLKVWYK